MLLYITMLPMLQPPPALGCEPGEHDLVAQCNMLKEPALICRRYGMLTTNFMSMDLPGSCWHAAQQAWLVPWCPSLEFPSQMQQ